MHPITRFTDVATVLEQQAQGYIAGRACTFTIGTPTDSPIVMRFTDYEDQVLQQRALHPPQDNTPALLEFLDTAMVQLTHMAVQSGLIETTPKEISHRVTITGSHDWKSTEVQIDGHTMRGVHSLQMNLRAGMDPAVYLGLSRSSVHMDQQFLPQNMTLAIEGMDQCLAIMRQVVQFREASMSEDMERAKLHSSNEEVELYRQTYALIHQYTPVAPTPLADTDTAADPAAGSAKLH